MSYFAIQVNMTPVIPYSTTSFSLVPQSAFTIKKNSGPSRCNFSRKFGNHSSFPERFILPLPTYVSLFPQYKRDCALLQKSLVVSATGTGVAVEEPNSPVVDEDSSEASEIPSEPSESSETSTNKSTNPTTAQSKRSRPGKKSEMPPVKNEDLVPGATFTGKVRSIQPFGAFVDFGAFTDGLVHVSRLSDSFVKDVASVVSIGQEVKVRIVEANMESRRISLTMRESSDGSKSQQRKDTPATASSDKPGPARRNTSKPNQRREQVKVSKFVKGQELEGTVKNLIRAGAFISLPEGEEGFLPLSEEYDDGFGEMMGGSSLQVGQEVSVRVLRISRGQVTLTMKKEEDDAVSDLEFSQGKVHTATNPFVLAFRQNKEIAAFLDDREKLVDSVKRPVEHKTSGETEQADQLMITNEGLASLGTNEASRVDETLDGGEASLEATMQANDVNADKEPETVESTLSQSVNDAVLTVEKDEMIDGGETPPVEATVEANVADDEKEPEDVDSSLSQSVDDAVQTVEKEETVDGGETYPVEATVEANVVDDEKELEKVESTLSQSVNDAVQMIEKDEMTDGDETSTVEATEVANFADDKKELEKVESSLSQSVDDAVQAIEKDERVDGGETSPVESIVEANVADDDKEPEKVESSLSQSVDDAIQTVEKDEAVFRGETSPLEATVETDVESDDKEPEKVESSLSQTADDTVQTVEKDEAVGGGETAPMEATVEADVESDEKEPEKVVSSLPQSLDDAVETVEKDAMADGGETFPMEANMGADVASHDKEPEKIESTLSQSVDDAVQGLEKESEEASGVLKPEEATSDPADDAIEEAVSSTNEEGIQGKSNSSEENTSEDDSKSKDDGALVREERKIQDSALKNEISSSPVVDIPSPQEAKDKIEVDKSLEPAKDSGEAQIPVAAAEEPSAFNVEVEKTKYGSVNGGTAGNSSGQNGSPTPREMTAKATISPALVKQLREETGAGMMDCKKALSETGGDIVQAQEFLRKKGLASAEKKASRTTAEGRIGSYIHDGRIGVLVEVNCETDFVARGDIFKELVDDLAMQVAACPQVQYLVPEDVAEEIVKKEKEIEMQKEDLLSKPEQIRLKIVEGRIKKRLDELALLEQAYIKNDKVVVKDWVKQTIATVGENMKVKRFIRFNLGEGLEKKSQDFAAEVAAQTAAKPVAAPAKEQPAATKAKETAQEPPAATISAALVKQLREETGAGMMDCKKALSETGGDLEKAQEYLRKKGLSTADKKSGRIAAEGRIGSYIHDSRIGVLIEVNCETDFVGRSEKFKELVDDLAMQVVACPQVQFVSIEDIPESIVSKEKELEMQREDLQSKPENIREKIVEGRITKRLAELALLEQSFIKDDKILVKDLVKQTVAALGENIKVRRFVRFTLGETNEAEKAQAEA